MHAIFASSDFNNFLICNESNTSAIKSHSTKRDHMLQPLTDTRTKTHSLALHYHVQKNKSSPLRALDLVRFFFRSSVRHSFSYALCYALSAHSQSRAKNPVTFKIIFRGKHKHLDSVLITTINCELNSLCVCKHQEYQSSSSHKMPHKLLRFIVYTFLSFDHAGLKYMWKNWGYCFFSCWFGRRR